VQVSAGASVHPSVYLNIQPHPAQRGAAEKASRMPAKDGSKDQEIQPSGNRFG
jgi:hypothetical protein